MASVRPDPTGVNGSSISRSGGRIHLSHVTLRESIAFAYGIATGRDYELLGPAWIDTVRFDIVATFSPEASRDHVREMMQELLIERFRLQTHRENRRFKSYALVVWKGGSRLQLNTTGAEGAFVWGAGSLTARAISMAGLADRLSGSDFLLARPVVDRTGIAGVYDFKLNWATNAATADGNSAPSLFTALQEQLGLKLETRAITFRILVVDHVERLPTKN